MNLGKARGSTIDIHPETTGNWPGERHNTEQCEPACCLQHCYSAANLGSQLVIELRPRRSPLGSRHASSLGHYSPGYVAHPAKALPGATGQASEAKASEPYDFVLDRFPSLHLSGLSQHLPAGSMRSRRSGMIDDNLFCRWELKARFSRTLFSFGLL